MAILLSVLALVVVGSSFLFASFAAVPQAGEQYVLFAHPTVQAGEGGVVAFASDAWGVPHSGIQIDLYGEEPGTGLDVILSSAETDGDGFARFGGLEEGPYQVVLDTGTINRGVGIHVDIAYPLNLTWATEAFDLDGSGFLDDLDIHFMDLGGEVPDGVVVSLEGEEVGSPDSRGFMMVKLNEGENNLTFAYGGEEFLHQTYAWEVFQPPNPFAEGPDFVLFFIALSFGGLLLPIVAVALSYDSISKEKVEGSADLLLYRPASWRSIAVGKFLGVFAAIALPVAAVGIAAALIITAVTGIMPSAMVILGFIAFSFFLLAVYILLTQTLSTIAKTAGTAIILAILLWFVFNVLWSVVQFLVTLASGIAFGSREYFVLGSYLGLFNPNSIYTNLFALAAPENLAALLGFAGLGDGIFALPEWSPIVAAVVWLVLPFVLLLEVYRRKAAG